jgi:hypothetical protein
MHCGDDAASDADGDDDEDGDGGSSDSGSDEYWFDEQFPGEAAAAQAGALATLSSAADVQAALEADASLARHPDFSAVLQRILSHGRADDVEGIRAISLSTWTQHCASARAVLRCEMRMHAHTLCLPASSLPLCRSDAPMLWR